MRYRVALALSSVNASQVRTRRAATWNGKSTGGIQTGGNSSNKRLQLPGCVCRPSIALSVPRAFQHDRCDESKIMFI